MKNNQLFLTNDALNTMLCSFMFTWAYTQQKTEPILQHYKLSKYHLPIILALYQKPYTISTLHKALHTPRQSFVTWLNHLRKHDIICDKKDTNDTRKTILSLTPYGHNISEQCINAMRADMAQALSASGAEAFHHISHFSKAILDD